MANNKQVDLWRNRTSESGNGVTVKPLNLPFIRRAFVHFKEIIFLEKCFISYKLLY